MKTRSFRLCSGFVLTLLAAGTWAQSTSMTATKGIATVKKLAISGDVSAQYRLGIDYARGIGVPKNLSQAAYWYREAAKRGLAEAQDSLASMYRVGLGVPQDYTQAAEWWRKAAEQGFSDAQNMLGRAYEEGEGVSQNYAHAAMWYRKAAEQNDALAQWSLGSLYELGHGVTQDYKEAYFWLNLAAAGQHPTIKQEDIDKIRDEAASHLSPAEISRVQARARKWSEEHAIKANLQ